MVLKTWSLLAVAKRVPLIKFRKGGAVMSASEPQPQSATSAAISAPPSSPFTSVQRGPIIEDWQLPARYRRKGIDPYEMEYINRGGPA